MRTVHILKGSHANETLMIIFVLYVKSLLITWYYLFAYFLSFKFFNWNLSSHEGRSCICGRVFRQFRIGHFMDVPKALRTVRVKNYHRYFHCTAPTGSPPILRATQQLLGGPLKCKSSMTFSYWCKLFYWRAWSRSFHKVTRVFVMSDINYAHEGIIFFRSNLELAFIIKLFAHHRSRNPALRVKKCVVQINDVFLE
jgi:hypothetical protein